MIRYRISYKQPASQYLCFSMLIPQVEQPILRVRIAAWRPGRYELGNFAKNVRYVKAYDEKGSPLNIKKIHRECWEIETSGALQVELCYEYFAGVLNAGSSLLDESQVYINPVNCFMFVEGREQEACEVELMVPDDYKVATGLKKISDQPRIFSASNFDRLADSPLIASATLKHHAFTVRNLLVHLWFQGECKPDFTRLENDFIRFIDEQIQAFGEFPELEYHFLFQITPHKSYHGVEHENCTVCMIGPTYQVFKDSYVDFLGLSSHEFYHSWNIKKIRPVEMYPYDFTKENYFRTGYIAEGVTTYMGDIMLYRSRVFNQSQYFKTIHEQLNKHFHNYGRFNMPVSEASFDMWVDGYETGVPYRKTSIYTEGALLALMIDIMLLEKTHGAHRLDDVMKLLYTDFACKGKGYTSEDFQQLLTSFSATSWDDFFRRYVNGIEDYEPILRETLMKVGLELTITPSKELYERNYGIKLEENTGKITQLAPDSPALAAGMQVGEVIATINGFSINGNIKAWFDYFNGEPLHLRTKTPDNRVRMIELLPENNNYYPDYAVKVTKDPTQNQKELFEKWTKNNLLCE